MYGNVGRKETFGKGTWRETFLDSGTMTPVLKSLEQKGFVTRNRSEQDERLVVIKITESGEKLKESAMEIPLKVAGCVGLEVEEAKELYKLLYKILGR